MAETILPRPRFTTDVDLSDDDAIPARMMFAFSNEVFYHRLLEGWRLAVYYEGGFGLKCAGKIGSECIMFRSAEGTLVLETFQVRCTSRPEANSNPITINYQT